MKNLIVKSMILAATCFTTQAHAAEKILMDCREKWSTFQIVEVDGEYQMKRQVVLDRVKGNQYVRGTLATTSEGAIMDVVSVKKTPDSLVFNLVDAKTLTFKVTQVAGQEEHNVIMSSDAENVEIQLGAILGTTENPLNFYSLACTIN